MNLENYFQIGFTFLGGGIIGAVINGLWASHTAKHKRKVDHLNIQIEQFYGPLCILVMQNERLLDLSNRIHRAYQEEYVNKKFSENELTQKRLRVYTEETIGVANRYIKEVEANNENIFELVRNSYAYADIDDTEAIMGFYEDYIRLKIERSDEGGKLSLPLEIYGHIGNISFMRPEFISFVREKAQIKKDELARLTR